MAADSSAGAVTAGTLAALAAFGVWAWVLWSACRDDVARWWAS